MNNLKKILKIANLTYINWIINPRIILFIILFVYFYDTIYININEILINMEFEINILEPFILIMTKGIYASFPPILYTMLISDFPDTKSSSMFFVFRISKKQWLQGQMIFSIYVTLTIILFLFLSTIISLKTNFIFGNKWSNYALLMETLDINFYTDKQALFINKNVYMQSYPYDAVLKIISLFILYMYLISSILMFFKLIRKRISGIILIFTLICASITTWITNASYMWFFPMANAIFSWRYTIFLSKPTVSLEYSYLYFFIPIFIFSIINKFLLKKYDFTYNN